MMTWSRPARVPAILFALLVALFASPARASNCVYPTGGGSQCFPTMMLVSPSTGLPISPASGDPQNAPYGQSGSSVPSDPSPGGAAVAPGRSFHVMCPPSSTAAQGTVAITLASGKQVQINLYSGGMYDAGWAVTQVGAITTVVGSAPTLAACVFQNIN